MRLITTFSICFITIITVFADAYMVINKSDGTKEKIKISEIQKIAFDLQATSILNKKISIKKMNKLTDKITTNPLNSRINFNVDKKAFVDISIWDYKGRLISHLLRETRNEGQYSVCWKGKDNAGNNLTTGSYIVKVKIGSSIVSEKLFILR